MTAFRSGLFLAFFYVSISIFCLVFLVTLLMPRRAIQVSVAGWSGMMIRGLEMICGTKWEIRGREHMITDGPVLYASKHQSAWETAIFYVICNDPAYVLKQELMRIPVWGWLARKAEAISVNRKGGGSALKSMVAQVKRALGMNRQVIIFPEGTRGAPGKSHPYHPGVAAIYSQIDAPVVPVALNSGMYWGRKSFFRFPGTITLEFLPPIPPGLDRKTFMNTLKERIETASNALALEAQKRDGVLPPERGETSTS